MLLGRKPSIRDDIVRWRNVKGGPFTMTFPAISGVKFLANTTIANGKAARTSLSGRGVITQLSVYMPINLKLTVRAAGSQDYVIDTVSLGQTSSGDQSVNLPFDGYLQLIMENTDATNDIIGTVTANGQFS